jgi:Protein of unknown function (DUF1553)/Protein of unknown function (DUF1549)/Planctomycete cytochrome C
MRLIIVLLFVSFGLALAQNDVQFFERKIRPVLAAHCWSCHSTKAKISFASLRLDTKPDSAIVVPGHPEASRLFQALLYKGSTKMPPTGMLPAAVIEDFRSWISAGAAWPDEVPLAVAVGGTKKTNPDHWAWKRLHRPAVPAVKNEPWARDEMDRFVLARLEAKGLVPVADATAEAWLRRVSLDLTGLPPTLAEQDEFLRERSYEKTVDRLLASPGFGQRWGRHWLDQTYYADNIEIGRRVPARHAWRYRDYVIDSINRDVPYPRFILEQLAGDQLPWTKPEERRNNLVATGFLALGPWPLVNADKVQLRMDVVDLQVDMVGRSFLGLTMGCSRCHDHKFDPITLADYYGMAGILASTRTLTGRMGLSVFSNINSVVLPELPEELAKRAEETREYWSRLTAAREELAALRAQGKPLDKEIAKANQAVKLLEYLPVVPPIAHAVQDADMPTDCRVNVRGNAHQLSNETPRSGVVIGGLEGKLDIADFTSGRKELAEWIGRKENPLTARVMVNRVWHHLFGAGIAPTIDNLGTRGTAPSHPELLDYLATEFMEGGWSLKKLVRRIALSRVYRLGGDSLAAGMEVDPENRLLWRMSRRRLEAETIRDAMLVVSGTMQASVGGPALPFDVPGNVNLAEPEFLNEEAKLDPATRLRRSVYLPVLRKSQLPELDILNLFNFPDANQITGPRQATTIPTQSLYLMNAPFVQEQAAALAESLLAMKTTDQARVRALARRVYGRELRAGEGEQWLAFVRAFTPAEAWKRLCHTLLISNEFLYRG